jgi:heptosyltransferase-2
LSDGRDIASVLVLRLSSVGDIVLTEPAVAALRETFPRAEIGFAVKERFGDLVSSHPAITRVHTLGAGGGALSALVSEIRGSGYSAVVDLHRNVRSARVVRASGIPLRTSYRKRELADTLRVRFLRRPFRASRLLVRRYLDALRPLGVEVPVRTPRLYVGERDAAAGAALLDQAGAQEGRFAVMVPGSVWATKRWPAERFAEAASRVVADLGFPVVLLGSAGERGLCDEVARSAGASVTSLAGRTTLGEMAAVIASARFFVGNDSGPTHMAMALEVPTVALFGPTDPGQFDFSRHALVYRDLPCSACSFYGGERCPLGHWDCMLGIEADDVLEASAALFACREDVAGVVGGSDDAGEGTA